MGAGPNLIFNGMTVQQIAKELSISTDGVQKRFRKAWPDRPWKNDMEFSPEEVRTLKEIVRSNKKTERPAAKKTAAIINAPAGSNEVLPGKNQGEETEKTPIWDRIRNGIIDVVLFCIVAGHALLIWFDCHALWGTPGLIGGGISFLIVLAALLFAMDSNRPRTSETAMWFVFFVDFGAFWVHYPTFKAAASIGNIETAALCIFLCGMSWGALYLFRDSKLG